MFDDQDMLDNFDNTIEALDQELHLLEQYKNILDQIAIISKTDIYGTITYVNQKFSDVSGYAQHELIGHPHNIVRHPDMPTSAFETIWQTIQSKQPWQGLVKNKRKDGTAYILHSHIFPILSGKNGDIEEFISVRFDVTQDFHKTALAELEQAKTQLQSKHDHLQNFYHCSSDVSHDWNQCLEQMVLPDLMNLKEWGQKYHGPIKFDEMSQLIEEYDHLQQTENRLIDALKTQQAEVAAESWHSFQSLTQKMMSQINQIAAAITENDLAHHLDGTD